MLWTARRLGQKEPGTQKEKKGSRAGRAAEGLWLSQRFRSASSRWRLQTCTCREPATGMRCTGTAQIYCKWLSTVSRVRCSLQINLCSSQLMRTCTDNLFTRQRSSAGAQRVFCSQQNSNYKPNIWPILRKSNKLLTRLTVIINKWLINYLFRCFFSSPK